MQYGDLTFLEIRDRARQGWVAIVPTGCTEQQGPHLPVDADTWQVEATTRAAAERAADRYSLKSLVLPTMPFGPTPEHRNFGWGYIDISAELHEALVRAIERRRDDIPDVPALRPRRFVAVEELVVAASARRRGIGTALMERAESLGTGARHGRG